MNSSRVCVCLQLTNNNSHKLIQKIIQTTYDALKQINLQTNFKSSFATKIDRSNITRNCKIYMLILFS